MTLDDDGKQAFDGGGGGGGGGVVVVWGGVVVVVVVVVVVDVSDVILSGIVWHPAQQGFTGSSQRVPQPSHVPSTVVKLQQRASAVFSHLYPLDLVSLHTLVLN